MPERKVKTSSLKDVDVFALGTHKGKTYTEDDLDDIVRNFKRFSSGDSPLVSVPSVIGHEENQTLIDGEMKSDLENTGIPRIATPTKLWKEKRICSWCNGSKMMRLPDGSSIPCPCCEQTGKQTVLKADFDGMHPKIAELIDGGHYDGVSAEIYDEDGLPEGVPAKGKMLRRIAFLGGELPHIKQLGKLPKPVYTYSEKTRSVLTVLAPGKAEAFHGGFAVFCEAKSRRKRRATHFSEGSMDRDAMIEKLKAMGADEEVLASMDERQLAACLKLAAKNEGGDTGDTGGNFSEEDLDGMSKEEGMKKVQDKIASYCSMGKKKYGEDWKDNLPPEAKYAEGGDDDEIANMEKLKKKEDVGTFSEKRITALVTGIVNSAVSKLISPVRSDVQKFSEEAKRARITTFVNTMVAQGRIIPSELDETSGLPTLIDDLMAKDDRKPVHKFSEGGKTRHLSDLDAAMKKIEGRPKLMKFGETVVNPRTQQDAKTQKEQKILKFWEENEAEFSKAQTKEEFVKVYMACSDKDLDDTIRVVNGSAA